jgi:hypothetical protein
MFCPHLDNDNVQSLTIFTFLDAPFTAEDSILIPSNSDLKTTLDTSIRMLYVVKQNSLISRDHSQKVYQQITA